MSSLGLPRVRPLFVGRVRRKAVPLLLVLLALAACASPLTIPGAPLRRDRMARLAATDLAGNPVDLGVHYVDVTPGGTPEETAARQASQGASDRALVFLHGWVGDGRVWSGQVPVLASLARLIVIDLPGHGTSDKPKLDYSVALFARAVSAVIDQAGVRRCVLVAHSNSSPVALALAREQPRRVRGLVSIEGALRLMIEDPVARRRLVSSFEGPGARQRALDMMRATLGPDRDPGLLADLLDMVAAVPRQVMESSLEGAWDPAAWSTETLDLPVLALMADSPDWSAEYERGLRTFLPDLRLLRLGGVTHFVQLDRPDEVNRLIATWVRQRNLLD